MCNYSEHLKTTNRKGTENEKNSIDAIQGKNLQNALKQNSFKGYLYELRIFKSDD